MKNFKRLFSTTLTASTLVLATCAQGCVVSKASYDQLQAQHEEQLRTQGRLQREMAVLADQLDQARKSLEQTELQLRAERDALSDNKQRLESRTEELADIEHQYTVTQKEREEANQRVTQLREELARVATHLGSFAEERDELAGERDKLATDLQSLSQRLGDLEARIIGAKVRSLLVRDLSLALHGPMTQQSLRLGVTSTAVVLTTRPDSLFSARTNKLTTAGKRLLSEVGRALRERTEVLELEELSDSKDSSGRDQRMQAISGQLAAAGVGLNRITYELPSADDVEAQSDEKDSSRRLRIWIRSAEPAQSSAKAQSPAERQTASVDPT